MKKRLSYIYLSILSFAICVLIVILFNNNPFIRGFTGDIVVISLLYFFIKIFYDFKPIHLASFVLGTAFIIEFLQYIDIVNLMGLKHTAVTRLIIGSVFDVYDLIAYTIGAALVYFIDIKLIRKD